MSHIASRGQRVHEYDRVILTGATGWVGRNAIDLLLRQHGDAVGDHVVLATSQPREIETAAGMVRTVATRDLSGLIPGPRTQILHCGFPTQDQVDVMGTQSYVDAITRLRAVMLAVIERLGPVDVVYLSSGAATSVAEGRTVAPRTRVYGQAKLDDEAAYADAIARAGGRLCVVRAFALSGPYITKPSTYALGSLIMQATTVGAIEVMATKPVRRSYTLMTDMLQIAMHAVAQIGAGEQVRFETAGEVVEVGDLAARVLSVLGRDPGAVSRPRLDPEAPADDYLGDPATMDPLAAAAGVVPAGLDAQIAATATWLTGPGAT